jgi:hypothetical protein
MCRRRIGSFRSASRPAGVRVLEEVFHPILINEEIRFGTPRDPDDVLVVVLDPTPDFLTVDQLDHNRSLVLGEPVDVFAFAVGNFWRRLPSITAAGEFILVFHCLLSMGIFTPRGKSGYC